jgi:hypothetical protein
LTSTTGPAHASRPRVSAPSQRHVTAVALLKHFASLVPLAQVARKPIFDIEQADGIGGGQIRAVAKARTEFGALVDKLRLILRL